MHKISEILRFPNQTPLEAIQVRIKRAFESKPVKTRFGTKTKQGVIIEDDTGEMRLTAWGQEDLSHLQGHEVTITCNGTGKGMKVNHNTYNGNTTIEVDLSAAAKVTPIGTAPSAPTASTGAVSAGPRTGKLIAGEAVGAAVNKAIDILIATSEIENFQSDRELADAIWKKASMIYRVADAMKSGKIEGLAKEKPAAPTPAPVAETPKPEPVKRPEPPMAYDPNDPQEDEDVPF